MKRRDSFKAGLAVFATAIINKKLFGAGILMDNGKSEIPKRKYNEEVDLSIIGFGGIVVVGMDQKKANLTVAESIDDGINYFDVAPSYWDGEAEEKLGITLQPYRKDIFLACKTMERDAIGAAKELDISLKRVGTDYFDLYQFHAVTTLDEVKQIFAPGGAMETFLEAQKEGKIRFIGFSAHSEEAAIALLDGYKFDSTLFPVNYVNYARSNFGPKVVDYARKKGAAVLALKSLAWSPWPADMDDDSRNCNKCWYQPIEDPQLAEKALRFTLSQDVTAAIPPGDEKLYHMALRYAKQFNTMSKPEQRLLLEQTAGIEPLFPI